MNDHTRYQPATGALPVPPPLPPSRGRQPRWWLLAALGVLVAVAAVMTAAIMRTPDTPAPRPAAELAVIGSATVTPPVWTPPSPTPVARPAVTDFAVSLKTVSKKCFGSAGCNVVVEPQLIYSGTAAVTGCDVTYTVTGDDSGEVVQTAYHSSGMDFTIQRSILSTKSSKVTPSATVTGVSCQ